MQNEPLEVTLKVTRTLEELGIPYLIAGSLASTLYGMVRTTQNSDIVAEMRLEHVRPFLLDLDGEFFMDEEMIADATPIMAVSTSSIKTACLKWIFLSHALAPFSNPN
jgi:hypothetical protein